MLVLHSHVYVVCLDGYSLNIELCMWWNFFGKWNIVIKIVLLFAIFFLSRLDFFSINFFLTKPSLIDIYVLRITCTYHSISENMNHPRNQLNWSDFFFEFIKLKPCVNYWFQNSFYTSIKLGARHILLKIITRKKWPNSHLNFL